MYVYVTVRLKSTEFNIHIINNLLRDNPKNGKFDNDDDYKPHMNPF